MDWDRDGQWEIQVVHEHYARLEVRFENAVPSIAELQSLRAALPEFRDISPHRLRQQIIDRGVLFKQLDDFKAREMRDRLEAAGVAFDYHPWSEVSYLPFDRRTNVAMLIEDPDVEREVVESMRKAGIPFVEIGVG